MLSSSGDENVCVMCQGKDGVVVIFSHCGGEKKVNQHQKVKRAKCRTQHLKCAVNEPFQGRTTSTRTAAVGLLLAPPVALLIKA